MRYHVGMTKTQSAQVTYRKTKTGEWVVYGPAAVIEPGRTVDVTKRDGTRKAETIERVGKPFAADGRQMVYGYLAKTGSTSSGRSTGTRRPSRNHRRYCDECGEPETPGTTCWETGFQH